MAVFDGGVFDSGVFDSGIGAFQNDAFQNDAFQTESGAATVESSFSANAVVRREQSGSFAANAVLRRDQSSSFAADEITRKPQSGSFAEASVVLREQPGSLTADAWKYTGFDLIEGGFTADDVVLRAQESSFAAAAITLKVQSSNFTADARSRHVRVGSFGGYSVVLGIIESHFHADAIIAVEVFFDDFDRTMPEGTGLGGQWYNWWGNYYSEPPDEEYDSIVDGIITQPAETDNGYTGFPKIKSGLVMLDVRITDQTDYWLWTGIAARFDDGSRWGTEFYANGNGFFRANVWSAADDSPVEYSLTPGQWYTIKWLVSAADGEDTRTKLWERGTPEPDWQFSSPKNYASDPGFAESYLELEGHLRYPAYYENFRLLAFEPDWTYDRLFNANAWIIAAGERTGTFYAKAEIWSPLHLGLFRADAIIRTTITRAISQDAYVAHWVTAKAIIAPYPGWRLGEIAADCWISLPWVRIESSFSADAIIRRTPGYIFNGWYDDFQRVVTQGLGPRYTWSDDDSNSSELLENVYVNGSSVVIPELNWNGRYNYESFRFVGLEVPETGVIQFDFWVNAAGDWTNSHPEYGIYIPSEARGVWSTEYTLSLYVGSGHSGSQGWQIWGRNAVSYFTPDENSWYTAQLTFTETTEEIRVWKQGVATPQEPLDSQELIEHSRGAAYIDFYYAPINADGLFDNLYIGNLGVGFGFTADAIIKRHVFLADARISIQLEDAFLAAAVISTEPQLHPNFDFTANAMFMVEHWGWRYAIYASAYIHGCYVDAKTADAWIDPPIPAHFRMFTADAFFCNRTFTSESLIEKEQVGAFTLDAEHKYHTDGSFTAKAVFVAVTVIRYGEATMDSWVIGTVVEFTADAQVSVPVIAPSNFAADAEISAIYRLFSVPTYFIVLDRFEDAFICSAEIVGGYFRADARIMPVFTANAYVVRRLFSFDAVLFVSRTEGLAADAIVQVPMGPVQGSNAIPRPCLISWDIWYSQDWLNLPKHKYIFLRRDGISGQILSITDGGGTGDSTTGHITHVAGSYVDANPTTGRYVMAIGSYGGAWTGGTIYSVHSVMWANGTTLSRPLAGQSGNRISWPDSDMAILPGCSLDAWSTVVTADAWIREEEDPGGWTAAGGVTADAWIVGTHGLFTVASDILRTMSSSKTADAFIIQFFLADAVFAIYNNTREIENAALIIAFPIRALTADAVIAFSFAADAFVQPWFSADAYIRREFASRLWFSANAYIYDPRWFTANAYLYKPGAINPPPPAPPPDDGDPNPPPTPPPPAGPPPQYSKIRILIKSGGITTDITKDVVWNETEFTQAAKTAPGTFRCTLRGEFTQYDGGEDIYVEVDGFRQFGGLVTMVEYDYWYPNVAIPKTVLLGTDYNIYFDKLVVWNREENTGTSGEYVPQRGYRAGLSDQSIIRHVCWHMIDLPPGFDLTHVDLLDEDWLDGERYYFNTGMSFREFMSEMSRVTAGVWWIDQFLALHYHARGVVTAPAAITDTQAGVSCRNLEWRGDSGSMVNDIFVWGTLATTVEGKIVLTRRDRPELIATHGLRQYAEFRSDLHDPLHIQKRANSIKTRRGIIMETASLDIFEGGFTAGQVVRVNMTTFDKSRLFVIRQVQTRFATMAPPDGTTYYGVPVYHLELGLDPEDPWNFYDMLPFDIPPWDVPFGFVFPQWGGFEICQSDAATDNEFIAHTVTFFEEDGMGFGDIWPTEGLYWPKYAYSSNEWPFKWGPGFGYGSHPYTISSETPSYFVSGGEKIPLVFGANMGGHLRTRLGGAATVIAHYEYATPMREGLFGVDVSAVPHTSTYYYGGTALYFGSSGRLTYPLGIDLDHQSGDVGGGSWSVYIQFGLTNSIQLSRPTLGTYDGDTQYSSAAPGTQTWEGVTIPDRFWIRIRPEADCIRVKLWDMCGPEPGHWTFETGSNPILSPLLLVGTSIYFVGRSNSGWTTLPEIQFSAIELSSSSGSGHLSDPSWPRYKATGEIWVSDRPDIQASPDGHWRPNSDVISKYDHMDKSGPWPITFTGWPGTVNENTDWNTWMGQLHGTSWNYTVRHAHGPAIGMMYEYPGVPSGVNNKPNEGIDRGWGTVTFSQNNPSEGTGFSRTTELEYAPVYYVTVDWPFYACFDWSWNPNPPSDADQFACATAHSGATRAVLRPSWAPYTFHFKARIFIAQNIWNIYGYPDQYGIKDFQIQFWKYNYGTGTPTGDYNRGLANREELLAHVSYYGLSSTGPTYSDVEWSYTFQPGESVLQYGVEIIDDGNKLARQHGIHGGIMFGPPTRTFSVGYADKPEVWFTWGDPTPDPLNGIISLPGIYAPLDIMPIKTVGGQRIIDSGDASLAIRDMPRWGWFTETVMVNPQGYFISSGGYVRGSFSVWFTGNHLVPEQDWVSVGPVGGMGSKLWRFQLTATYRNKNPGVGMVSLTYLIDNPAADPAWTRPSRTTVTDVRADRNRMIDIRGLN